MPLTRPYPIDKAFPNAIDLRKQLSGIIPREGIFPDPVTVNQGIAYANGAWNVGARPFIAAFKRGGAPSTQAYGTGLGTNDAAATAWTVPAAPGSGTQITRLWVRWTDPTQGEALTVPAGETVPRAVPTFGSNSGTSIGDLPALTAGVMEIAQVSMPSGAASIAGATITQIAPFAHVVGGPVLFRNATEQAAYAPADGTEGYRLDEDRFVDRIDGAWRPRAYAIAGGRASHGTNIGPGVVSSAIVVPLPAGRFTVPPLIKLSVGNVRLNAQRQNVGTTSFEIVLANWSPGTANGPIEIDWTAEQMTRTAAAG